MTKMIRTARGELVDWDLIRVQSERAKNVAEKVEITTETKGSIQERRARRAKMDAARKALEASSSLAQEQSAQPNIEQPTDVKRTKKHRTTVSEEVETGNGWEDEVSNA